MRIVILIFLILCFILINFHRTAIETGSLNKPGNDGIKCDALLKAGFTFHLWADWLSFYRKELPRRNPRRYVRRLLRLLSRMRQTRKKTTSKGRASVDTEMEKVLSELTIEQGWSEKEFSGIQLGDKRLNKRLLKVADKFGEHPLMPINQACKDWKDVKAAYRLFYNEKVKPEKILFPHQKRTQERMKGYSTIFGIQDSTLLNYSHHPETTGLGSIGTSQQGIKGLVMHSTLAITPEKLPLGVLTQSIWAREEGQGAKKDREIEEKESSKWLKALREAAEWIPDGVRFISICDREADIYEYFMESFKLKINFLIRAAQNRALDKEMGKLWDYMEKQEITQVISLEIPAKDKQPKREALISIRFSKVTLRPPNHIKSKRKATLKPVEIWAVLAKEVDPPAHVKEPVEWMLLTDVPVNNGADAIERIQWYTCRWQIETYHKVLKSGCKVEDCRLGTADRLCRYLTVFTIIAWRLFWMTHINRTHPNAPATMVMADHEWKVLYAVIHNTTQLPEQVPTVRQVVRWTAQLGGFLARKGDKEPGVTTIWRGWQRLTDYANLWLIIKTENQQGPSPSTYG